jgi:type II secretory pathway component GspD/PulD (secretin)
MRWNRDAHTRQQGNFVPMLVGLALGLVLLAPRVSAHAQTTDEKPAEPKSADARGGSEGYATIYLHNAPQQNDLNDIQTALRNMLPRAKIYGTPSQSSISLRGSAEDLQQAQKIVAELDRPRPTYRLTYTINESESGKRVGSQRYTLIVLSGGRSEFKQGNRVPIITATSNDGGTPQNSVTYIDVGLNIEATVDGSPDGVRVRSKVAQSSMGEEKSGATPDPTIRQNSLDGTSMLTPGKPLVLGALDVPGTTRHEDIEVVAELVK